MTETPTPDDQLLLAITELTQELQRVRLQQRDWRISLRNGILAGLGGVLGATVLVSLFLYFLQPLKRIEGLSPTIDKLDRILQRTK